MGAGGWGAHVDWGAAHQSERRCFPFAFRKNALSRERERLTHNAINPNKFHEPGNMPHAQHKAEVAATPNWEISNKQHRIKIMHKMRSQIFRQLAYKTVRRSFYNVSYIFLSSK